MHLRLVLNLLAVCGSAVFTGMMLTVALTLGAYWQGLPPASFLDWFAAHSHLIARAVSLIAAPTLVGLAGSLWLSPAAERRLWALALACAAGIAIVTVAYHLPTNAAFVAKSIAVESVPATLDRWLALHWLRIALGAGAAVLGALALRAPPMPRG